MTNKSCIKCKLSFEVSAEDRKLLQLFTVELAGKKFSIPEPTMCPACRQQRRLAWRNERSLYQGQCDLCQRGIVSLYAPEKKYQVYCQKCWWGDRWDPLSFGREIDFTRQFFAQYAELQQLVPRLALYHLHSENSDYTNHSSNNRNCYMGVAFGDCEDCLYGNWVLHSRHVVDSLYINSSESCYECIYCEHCYQTFHGSFCQNVSDSVLIYDCRNCSHCLGCVQLTHKQYQVLNQPVAKDEFVRIRSEILSSRQKFLAFRAQFEQLRLGKSHRATHQINCVDSIGTDLYNCKNAYHCFNCRELEDCRYMYDLGNNKHSMDCYEHGWLVPSELIYENHAGMQAYRLLFCNICSDSRELSYCDLCVNNCSNCFGCVGLKAKSYSILNRQYSIQDYQSLVGKLIDHMTRNGEWGEFFPAALSPFGYNETPAPEYFPLSREEATACGFRWSDYVAPRPTVAKTLLAKEVPQAIDAVSDDILDYCIECEVSHRPFRITKQELLFYRQHRLPLPTKHPDQRHVARTQYRHERKLRERECRKCFNPVITTYAPERPEIVYCDQCYLKEIY